MIKIPFNKRVDVLGGDMTYGQRIELGKILSDDSISDYERFENVFYCLHGNKPSLLQYPKLVDYYTAIINGIVHWSKTEEELLHYEPTEEERRAGVKEYHTNVGELSAIHSMAKNFSKDPDEVLNWDYAKVFGILLNDLESYKYQQRFNKILTSKH